VHLALFVIFIGIYLFPSSIRFEKMNLFQGFPSDSVNALFQDRYGFIWVGCDEGLLRYDGQSFQLFRPEPDLPGTNSSLSVSSIIQDNNGVFWIGTYGSGLYALNPNTETFTTVSYLPVAKSDKRYFIYRLMQDTKGAIWISSWGFGLSKYDPSDKSFTHFTPDSDVTTRITNTYFRPIIERNNGSVWFGSGDGQIYYVDTEEPAISYLQLYWDDAQSIPLQDNVFSLLFDSDDDLWVGTLNSGLWHCRIQNNQLTVIHRYQGSSNPDKLGDNHIRDLLETSQLPGQIWVCTDYGLYVYNKKSQRFNGFLANPKDNYSLSRNYLSCIFEDRTGLLWLGTINGGLMKFSPHANPFSTQIPKLQDERRSHSEVTSLLHLDNQRIILGGFASTLTLTTFQGEQLMGEQISLSDNELNSNRILALAADPNAPDTVLIGTTWSGLKKLSFLGLSHTITSEEFASKKYQNNSANTVNDILALSRNEIWYATNAGIFIRKSGETQVKTQDNSAGMLPDNRIICLFHAGDGIVWIGTQVGLSLFSTKTDNFLPLSGYLGPLKSIQTAIRTFHKTASGEIWIGTNDGLVRLPKSPDDTVLILNHEDGLANKQVLTIQSDKTGHLWLGTGQGLSRYEPISRRFFNYDIYNGLDNHRLACSYYESERDLMIFGGINGLTTFKPSQIRPTPYPPVILFTGFETINPQNGTTMPLSVDKPAHLTKEIRLKQGRPLIIHFSAMDFSAPQKNQYQYRLLGFDDQWHFTEPKRQQAHFQSLSPGDYELQVKGSNSDGVWNVQGATLLIKVSSPWWKSPLFLFFALSLLVSTVTLIYQNRLRLSTYRKNEQEKLHIFYNAHSISQREVEIIELLVAGHSNKEIEDILFISLPTVKSHIYHIFKKLNVSSRSQLLALINRSKGTPPSQVP